MTGEVMIHPSVWRNAIRAVGDDAEASLSNQHDRDKVRAVLGELADRKPPKVEALGEPFSLAQSLIAKYLQHELAAHAAIEVWLDGFSSEISAPPFRNE